MSVQWKTGEPTRAELAGYDDLVSEPSSSFPPGTLVTIRYLWDAVRRHIAVWLTAALAGLIGGLALPFVLPEPAEASTTVLVTHREGDDPARAVLTDISLLESLHVAEATAAALGSPESPHDLRTHYTVTQLTVRVIEVRASAPDAAEATALAETVAEVFLEFRAEQFTALEHPLQDQLAIAERETDEAAAAVREAGGDPNDPDPPRNEQTEALTEARERQLFLEQQLLDQEVQLARMNSSRVLDDAAPVPRNERFSMAISAASGMAAGLVLGLGFVIVRAMTSDHLWRRQDVARVIGAPVALNVPRPPFWRRFPLPQYFDSAVAVQPEITPVVAHLRKTVPWDDDTETALAVVAIDNARYSAILVASLALALAEDGYRVFAADLSGTGALATALGVRAPGVHESRFANDDLSLAVYLADPRTNPHVPDGPGDHDAVELAREAADVTLTLTTVSPALGAEHIPAWATHVAALVTAGKSSATTLEATGELIRLTGLRLDAVILLHTDRTDNSLGVPSEHSSFTHAGY